LIGAGLQQDTMRAYDRFAGMRVPGLTMAQGGEAPFVGDGGVPGEAPVEGDSEQNDVVPAYLSPGEVVLPRSVAQAPDAPAQAALFVQHLMRRREAGPNFEQAMQAQSYSDGGLVDPVASEAVKGWWAALAQGKKSASN
jgi:hypothetical protein